MNYDKYICLCIYLLVLLWEYVYFLFFFLKKFDYLILYSYEEIVLCFGQLELICFCINLCIKIVFKCIISV